VDFYPRRPAGFDGSLPRGSWRESIRRDGLPAGFVKLMNAERHLTLMVMSQAEGALTPTNPRIFPRDPTNRAGAVANGFREQARTGERRVGPLSARQTCLLAMKQGPDAASGGA